MRWVSRGAYDFFKRCLLSNTQLFCPLNATISFENGTQFTPKKKKSSMLNNGSRSQKWKAKPNPCNLAFL